MFTGGDGGDGNQPTLQQILERMRKLEQDLAAERALRQTGNPGGTTVPGQGTSAPPVVPGRAARDASAITRKGENALANAATSQMSSSKRGGYKKDGTRLPKTCFICGGEGHFALQCPRKKEGGERSYLCYVCGSDKHKAYACPKRAAAGGQPPPKGGSTDGGAKGQASS
jgi:hypothetical protein